MEVYLDNKLTKTDRLYFLQSWVFQCLQHHVVDVYKVCGGRCHLLWCGVLSSNTNSLNKLIRRSCFALKLNHLHVVAEKSMLPKTLSVLNNPSVLAAQRSTFSRDRSLPSAPRRATGSLLPIGH